jgi:hypothetical protein
MVVLKVSCCGIGPSLSRSTPSLSRGTPSLSRSTPSLSRGTPSLSRSTPSLSRSTPSLSRSTPSLSRGTPRGMGPVARVYAECEGISLPLRGRGKGRGGPRHVRLPGAHQDQPKPDL